MTINAYSFRVSAGLLAVFLASTGAAAGVQLDTTGSRAGHHSAGRVVVSFDVPAAIRRVQALMENGQNDEALALIEDYVASLDNAAFVGGGSEAQQRYLAFTAHCAALTGVGRLDEAVSTCTDAIELNPSRWTAINNRGTAHFAGGDYEAALADYERAREVAPKGSVMAAIEHNIGLARRRLAADGD